ncbi:MAG: hypothetical protein BWY09_02339 [Candidatus Hydrogenedentes bacterium ADurb.Bin179]|nr:MAG: hypothetical protein BWY09_02339 [Candidatus Hydrogenedentes bacterium ADurb.Bin179]
MLSSTENRYRFLLPLFQHTRTSARAVPAAAAMEVHREVSDTGQENAFPSLWAGAPLTSTATPSGAVPRTVILSPASVSSPSWRVKTSPSRGKVIARSPVFSSLAGAGESSPARGSAVSTAVARKTMQQPSLTMVLHPYPVAIMACRCCEAFRSSRDL